jgi:hypothetical protein
MLDGQHSMLLATHVGPDGSNIAVLGRVKLTGLSFGWRILPLG